MTLHSETSPQTDQRRTPKTA